MRLIKLDASNWAGPADFYVALFAKLRSPTWHGQNFNALRDGLSGGINGVEAPFTVEIRNSESAKPAMVLFLRDAVTVFDGARQDFGVDVRLRLC